MGGPRVFVSYSHRDEPVLKALIPFLATLKRDGLVVVWTDQQIRAGERWHAEIDSALNAATIAVLLISQEFLASPFIRDEELPRILERQLAGHMTVLPVFVSPSTVTSDSVIVRDAEGKERRIVLSELQGFGTPDKTLSEIELPERKRRFVEIHNRIRELASGRPIASLLPSAKRDRPDPRPTDAQRPRISRIPFPRNRTFTGREEYLQKLHEQLGSGKPTAVTQALAGLGGIGKTQLALEYSYRFGYEYEIVWWIRAENEDTRLDDLRALGHELGIDAGIDPSRLVDVTLEWLDRRDDWLLVFDNAERADDIRNLLPQSGRGRILITSRNPAWGAVAKTVNLPVWTAEEAVGYLSRRTGLSAGPATRAVAETLGYLPLALAQAAAYIDETGCGFDGYLALLEARPAETLKLRPNTSDAEKAVATVWDIAFQRVAASSPAAVELLNLFAFLPPDRIPRRLLVDRADRLPPVIRATIEDQFALDAAIGALRRYSLVDTPLDGFSLHRLVQAVVRGRLENDTYRMLSETAKDLESELSAPAREEAVKPTVRRHRWLYVVVALAVIGGIAVATIVSFKRRAVPRAEPPREIVTTAQITATTPKRVVAPPIRDAVGLHFDGIAIGDGPLTTPPSPTGAAGPHHYIQTAASSFAIYDKSGRELLAPSLIQTLWKGHAGACATGDVIGINVQYDHLADRWVLGHSAVVIGSDTTQQQCLAVSKTSDPLKGGWYLYSFNVDPATANQFDDYPSFAVWPRAYSMTSNVFADNRFIGSDVWIFEREAMLQGRQARHRRFQADDRGMWIAANLTGPVPPLRTPVLLLRLISPVQRSQAGHLELFALHVDWSDDNRPLLESIADIKTDPFKPLLCDHCVPQPGTENRLDVIGDRMMWPVQYRNFDAYETIVANHTVDVGSGDPMAGIRWYELRRPAGGVWSIFQQGTLAPSDQLHRWVGSIAMDPAGNIALGYSVSSNTVAPGIRYVSRRRDDPPGHMGQEIAILVGRGVQPTIGRWGNTSSISADPAVPCSFWYTNEYLRVNGDSAWRTHIANVRPPKCEGTR